MLFDFMDEKSGRIDPGYKTLARIANISIRSVARGIRKLKAAGVINWVRRVYAKPTENPHSGWRMAQDTNAYAIVPPSQWRGFHPPADPPAPQPGTWGDHPPMPDALGRAAEELKAGGTLDTILHALDMSDGNPAAGILARMIRNRNK